MAVSQAIPITRHPFANGSYKQMLIDGKWVDAASGKRFETHNPATGELLATVAEGDKEDIDRAVAAARRAFEGPWSKVKPFERQNVRSLTPRIEGNFAVGMPSSLGSLLAAPLVLRMNAEFPNIKLRIMEGITGSLIDWLHRGMLDFALLEEESRDERLTDHEIISAQLMLVGAAGTCLNPKRAMSFEKVTQLPLILPTHHLGIRGIFNDALTRLRESADIRFEADSCELIKELVANGMGYALLPLTYFQQEYASGALRYCPIVKPSLQLPTFLSYRTSSRATGNRVEGLVIDTITRMIHELHGQRSTNTLV